MKALAIVALIFACLSIFVPVGGVFLAMLCSFLALIAFRSQSTLAGVTFGINIVNTAFLSPSLLVAEAVNSSSASTQVTTGSAGSIYFFYVGFHVVLFAVAILSRLLRGAPK
jgi:hypothetical protein